MYTRTKPLSGQQWKIPKDPIYYCMFRFYCNIYITYERYGRGDGLKWKNECIPTHSMPF